jgi:hypothetical protein
VDLPRARLNADQKRKESKMFQAQQLGATLKTGNKINAFFSAPAGWSSFLF